MDRNDLHRIVSPAGLALLILLVAGTVRLIGLSDPGLWHDEALSHYYARQPVDWLLFYCARDINHPPLFFLSLKAWLNFVPTYNQFLVELLVSLFGIAGVGLLLKWGYERLPARTWWLPGLFMALNVSHVYYSGELRMYAPMVFFVLGSGYFTDRLLDKPGRTLLWIGWVTFSLCSLYTHSFSIVWVVLFAIFLGFNLGKDRILRFLISVASLFLLYAPWGSYVLIQALDIKSGYWLPDFRWPFLLSLFRLLGGVGQPIAPNWFGVGATLLLFITLLIPVILALITGGQNWIRLAGLALLVPILFVVVASLSGQSVFIHRVFLPVIPFMLLLVAFGLARYGRIAFYLTCTLYLALLLSETVNLKNNPPNQYARQVAQWTGNIGLDDKVLIHTSGFSYFPSIFYHGNKYDEYLQYGSEHVRRPISSKTLNKVLSRRTVLLLVPNDSTRRFVKNNPVKRERVSTNQFRTRKYTLYRITPDR